MAEVISACDNYANRRPRRAPQIEHRDRYREATQPSVIDNEGVRKETGCRVVRAREIERVVRAYLSDGAAVPHWPPPGTPNPFDGPPSGSGGGDVPLEEDEPVLAVVEVAVDELEAPVPLVADELDASVWAMNSVRP